MYGYGTRGADNDQNVLPCHQLLSDVSQWKADVLCEDIWTMFQAQSWPLITRLSKRPNPNYVLPAFISRLSGCQNILQIFVTASEFSNGLTTSRK